MEGLSEIIPQQPRSLFNLATYLLAHYLTRRIRVATRTKDTVPPLWIRVDEELPKDEVWLNALKGAST